MTDLKRYEEIKEAFQEKIEFKNDYLFFNSKKINLIKNLVPNFISDDLDNLTNLKKN